MRFGKAIYSKESLNVKSFSLKELLLYVILILTEKNVLTLYIIL
nr:MAG TPA_asm: hypothetical protein [Caudoviricetes sp.]